MTNQWILRRDNDNEELYCDNFDDYGYGPDHSPSIGDEIETSETDDGQFGIVLDIIRNIYGDSVCYKVWRSSYGEDGRLSYSDGCFDYIRADTITLCEPCGSSEWSLGRIGYELREMNGNSFLYNQKTKDVIAIW